jgi:hypothetical protein
MARAYPSSVKGWGEAQRKYDVFARLNNLRDWNGYSKKQEECRIWLKDWLLKNTQMVDSDYKNALPVAYCKLPHYSGDAYAETCHIFEREVWWILDDLGTEMQSYKSANRAYLEDRRKQIYHNAQGDSQADPNAKPYGWNQSNRTQRYDYLQVATKYGSAWDEWKKTHNTTTGEPKDTKSWRDKSADWHNAHLGITESPANSNCDSRSDGIRTSQDGCANGTWLRNQPWCGCWAWSGLYAAGKVKKGDSWLASVASIEDYARAGRGPFKGWTTDGSKAGKGDLVVLFGRGVHVGTVREITSSTCRTWEGNTSSASGGSQSNGGGSYKRDRSRSGEVYGYALVG